MASPSPIAAYRGSGPPRLACPKPHAPAQSEPARRQSPRPHTPVARLREACRHASPQKQKLRVWVLSDMRFSYHGSVWFLTPTNDLVRKWLAGRNSDLQRRYEGALLIEPTEADRLVERLRGAGFRVRAQATVTY